MFMRTVATSVFSNYMLLLIRIVKMEVLLPRWAALNLITAFCRQWRVFEVVTYESGRNRGISAGFQFLSFLDRK